MSYMLIRVIISLAVPYNTTSEDSRILHLGECLEVCGRWRYEYAAVKRDSPSRVISRATCTSTSKYADGMTIKVEADEDNAHPVYGRKVKLWRLSTTSLKYPSPSIAAKQILWGIISE
jgi:hypothetical protein